jgi:TPR repeat protein
LPQKVLAVSDEGITSFQLYQPKTNHGDADAQFNLALLYFQGTGTPQDTKQAFFWYAKAAEQGHYFAKEERGRMLKRCPKVKLKKSRNSQKNFTKRYTTKPGNRLLLNLSFLL